MKRFTALTMSVAALVLGICGWRAVASASSVASASTSVHQEEELLVQDSLAVSAVPDASTEIMAVRGFFASMEGDAQAIADVLATVPEDESTVVFSLANPDEAPFVPSAQLEALEEALEAIDVPASFLLVDAETGWGISHNAFWANYAASSSKAWFALFLCQMAQAGELDLTEHLYGYSDEPLNQNGNWESPDCVGAYIENAVLYSDNSAYESLREAYDWQGYDQWLEELGLQPVVIFAHYWYPALSPVASVQLWMNMYSYLASGAQHAAWLSDLLANTNVSYLRQGMDDAGFQATVLNKAGWDVLSTCDSGLIQVNGHTYFAAVITQLTTSDESDQQVVDLSAALVQAALALQ